MSRKRGKKPKAAVEAIPEDILAEGSGPVGGGHADADAIATVEDVVTTADIATTDDVVTADDVVATAVESSPGSSETGEVSPGSATSRGAMRAASETVLQPQEGAEAPADTAFEAMGAAVASGIDLAALGDQMASAGSDGGGIGDRGGGDGEGGDGNDGDGDGNDGDGGDDDPAIVFPTSAASMDAEQLKHLVEALIFASDRPLTVQRLRQLTRVGEVRRLEHALAELAEDFRERGLVLQQVSGGYQFRTRTQFSPWVQQLIAGRPVRLSRAQLETLAIIAYRQPITRPEIDDIRGVDSTATLKLLIDRMLIRVLGKREEVGRPILYGTTKEFLDFFSLGDLRELPTLREYSELTAESRKVMSDRLGIEPDGASSGDANGANGTNGAHGSNGANGAHGSNGSYGANGSDGSHGSHGTHAESEDADVAPGDDAGASAMDLADAAAPFLSAENMTETSEPSSPEPDGDESMANAAPQPGPDVDPGAD